MTDNHMTDDSVTNDCVTDNTMPDNTMPDGKRFRIFLLVAFGFGWLLQTLGMLLGGVWYQLCVTLCMFAPLLGVVVSHRGIRRARTGIGWRPNVAGLKLKVFYLIKKCNFVDICVIMSNIVM